MLAKKCNSKFRKVREFWKKISLPIVKQPAEIKHSRMQLMAFSIIGGFLLDILSFSLKGAQIAMDSGFTALAIILLIMYFSQRVLENSYHTYCDSQRDSFKKIYNDVTTGTILDLCYYTNNKVFKKKGNLTSCIDLSELLQKSKRYLQAVWQFWWNLPEAIAQVTTLLVMIIGMIAVELKEGELYETLFATILLIICIIIYFILGKKRIRLMAEYRKSRIENDTKQENMFSEIQHLEYMSPEDFKYHAERFRKQLEKSTDVQKKERLKLNVVFIQRSFVSSGFMITLLLFKLFTSKSFSSETILNVVAISTVYSTILNKVASILSRFEDVADTIIDINTLYPEFANIYQTYLEETKDNLLQTEVDSIIVKKLAVSKDPAQAFQVINETPFKILSGEIVSLVGPTGCGKSTLNDALSNRVIFEGSPIEFVGCTQNGRLGAITYQTDRVIANNFVLNEICLTDKLQSVDTEKLMYLLKGLALYKDLLYKSNENPALSELNEETRIIELLKIRKYNEFSSGQKQRLALTKLMYNLNDTHKIVALDEPFNRLDDETAEKCIPFVFEYVQADKNRFIFVPTHQVDLVNKYASKEISFKQNYTGKSFVNVRKL